VEVDFHWSGQEDAGTYMEHMAEVEVVALNALVEAHGAGAQYLLLTHGASTSEGWKQSTSRSVIRGLMRSPKATPYIDRARCIQHATVFVAAIRPRKPAEETADP
jgi:hypothetical protein